MDVLSVTWRICSGSQSSHPAAPEKSSQREEIIKTWRMMQQCHQASSKEVVMMFACHDERKDLTARLQRSRHRIESTS